MTRLFYNKNVIALPLAALCLLTAGCETARPVVSAPLYPHQKPYEGAPFPLDEIASRKTGGSVRIFDVYGAYNPPAYVPFDHNARQVPGLIATVPPSAAVQAVRGPVAADSAPASSPSSRAAVVSSGTSQQPLRAARYGASVVERAPPGKNYN